MRSGPETPVILEGSGPMFFIRQAVGGSWSARCHYADDVRDLAVVGCPSLGFGPLGFSCPLCGAPRGSFRHMMLVCDGDDSVVALRLRLFAFVGSLLSDACRAIDETSSPSSFLLRVLSRGGVRFPTPSVPSLTARFPLLAACGWLLPRASMEVELSDVEQFNILESTWHLGYRGILGTVAWSRGVLPLCFRTIVFPVSSASPEVLHAASFCCAGRAPGPCLPRRSELCNDGVAPVEAVGGVVDDFPCSGPRCIGSRSEGFPPARVQKPGPFSPSCKVHSRKDAAVVELVHHVRQSCLPNSRWVFFTSCIQ